ncbi:MAG: hypothetical protein FD174_1314 [Geobacteraceae bacterium]|nr:MAG: hypothetical protein FD174_1314 [Geobacteraceae bacterium]
MVVLYSLFTVHCSQITVFEETILGWATAARVSFGLMGRLFHFDIEAKLQSCKTPLPPPNRKERPQAVPYKKALWPTY